MAGIYLVSSSSLPGRLKQLVPFQDKLAHLVVFASLGFLLGRAARVGWCWSWNRAALFAVAIASAYGLLDEWHQSTVPGRTAEIWDWIADTAGAALAQIPLLWASGCKPTSVGK
jgi:VanZ family protein